MQVIHMRANSSHFYGSSCIFKRLRAELFFQIHAVVPTTTSCNCWSLTVVCEKSNFGCQMRAFNCWCKGNTQECNTGQYSNVCRCKCILAFTSEYMSLWSVYRLSYNTMGGTSAWTKQSLLQYIHRVKQGSVTYLKYFLWQEPPVYYWPFTSYIKANANCSRKR